MLTLNTRVRETPGVIAIVTVARNVTIAMTVAMAVAITI